MKKSAGLIGHNFNSMLAIARVLAPEGYEIGAIRTGSVKGLIGSIGYSPEKKSRFISRYYVSDSASPEDVIRTIISRFVSEGCSPVLFPVDDLAAEILDNNYNMLSRHFVLPNVNGTQGGVVRLMDKACQKQLARESGVPVIEGCAVKISSEKYDFPQNITYPCFVKPETSFKGRKKFMGKCVNEQELRAILDSAAKTVHDCSMLVEDYVKIDREYCIAGLCNGSKVCIPDVIDEIVMGHESHSGVTCYGKILDPGKFAYFIAPLKDFLSKLGFRGLFTIDVLESGGKLYFCELNMRMGASGAAVLMAGANLALMMCKVLYGENDMDYSVKCRELTFANEKPLISDFGLKYISWKEYKNYINKADIRFLYSPEDKSPMRAYMLFVLKQWAKRFLK